MLLIIVRAEASHPNTDFVAQHYDFTKEIGRGSFGKAAARYIYIYIYIYIHILN